MREAGFSIVAQRNMKLTTDLVDVLYESCKTKEFYDDLVASLTRSVIVRSLFIFHRHGSLEPGEASTHKSAKTHAHAGNVFVTRDLDL